MEEIEIEFKNKLTREEYEELKRMFDYREVVQKSIYLDTSDISLLRNKIALRIRSTNELNKLTIKHQFDNYIKEISDVISDDEVKQIIISGIIHSEIISDYLSKYDLVNKGYQITATFETKRSYAILEDCKIFLDQTTFENNEVDYELEIEYDDYEKGLVNFHQFLTEHGISSSKTEHKISRAIRNRK